MSRLDVFIDRMVSQRACLNHAVHLLADITGPVFELGLGNGRTFHHLREIMGARDIYVFERNPTAQPNSMPAQDRLILGDVRETLQNARIEFGGKVALIHADLGGHDLAKNDAFARELSPLIVPLLAPGGLMISSDRTYLAGVSEPSLPPDAVPGRCFVYQRPL